MNESPFIFKMTLEMLSEGADGAVIARWHTSENVMVRKGDDLLEVVTDKASFDVVSPYDGLLVKILKGEGSVVGAGEVVAEISVS